MCGWVGKECSWVKVRLYMSALKDNGVMSNTPRIGIGDAGRLVEFLVGAIT